MNIIEYMKDINNILTFPRQLGKTEITSKIIDWKLVELTDKFVIENLMDSYKRESIVQYHEDQEPLGLDEKLLDSLETVIKYFATKEQIEEFNLKYKKTVVNKPIC